MYLSYITLHQELSRSAPKEIAIRQGQKKMNKHRQKQFLIITTLLKCSYWRLPRANTPYASCWSFISRSFS